MKCQRESLPAIWMPQELLEEEERNRKKTCEQEEAEVAAKARLPFQLLHFDQSTARNLNRRRNWLQLLRLLGHVCSD